MTHVQTLYNISVGTYIDNESVLSAARAFLEGYTGEYYFFQQDSDTYLLLYDFEGTFDISNLGCNISDGCKVYQIDVATGMYTDIEDSITGSLLGTEEQYFSGTYTHREFSHPLKAESYVYHGSVSVSNVSQSFLVYSSSVYHPHLIEGVQNYAVAAFLFALGICVFKLSDRLFRRIY